MPRKIYNHTGSVFHSQHYTTEDWVKERTGKPLLQLWRAWKGPLKVSIFVRTMIDQDASVNRMERVRVALKKHGAYEPGMLPRVGGWKWTEERIAKARSVASNLDKTARDIGREFGVSAKAIRDVHQTHDIGLRGPGQPWQWTRPEIDKFVEMAKAGSFCNELAKEFKKSQSSIWGLAKRIDVRITHRPLKDRNSKGQFLPLKGPKHGTCERSVAEGLDKPNSL